MSINRVIVSGNLTRDPELRTTASGNPVMGFGIAVNDRRKNSQTGEWEDYPNFVDCTMFGTRAQSVSRLSRIVFGNDERMAVKASICIASTIHMLALYVHLCYN